MTGKLYLEETEKQRKLSLNLSFFNSFFRRNKKKENLHFSLSVPVFVEECEGVTLNKKTIKSFLFSTDMALVENSNADAVLAVYPFKPSPQIIKSLIDFSQKPVICGIGGGITKGQAALQMAQSAEDMGAAAIIVNQPFPNKDIEKLKKKISIPVISSVSTSDFDFKSRVNAGADYFHITGGKNTITILEHLKYCLPGFPLIATAGNTSEDVKNTVQSGVRAVVLSPPSSKELFREIMDTYRKGINQLKK